MFSMDYEKRGKNKEKLAIKSGSPEGIAEIIVQLRKEENEKAVEDNGKGLFAYLKEVFWQLVYTIIRKEL